jgi:hypothetical protein
MQNSPTFRIAATMSAVFLLSVLPRESWAVDATTSGPIPDHLRPRPEARGKLTASFVVLDPHSGRLNFTGNATHLQSYARVFPIQRQPLLRQTLWVHTTVGGVSGLARTKVPRSPETHYVDINVRQRTAGPLALLWAHAQLWKPQVTTAPHTLRPAHGRDANALLETGGQLQARVRFDRRGWSPRLRATHVLVTETQTPREQTTTFDLATGRREQRWKDD